MYITIKDFLRDHPDAEFDIMTSLGMIQLKPRQVQELLKKDGSRKRLQVSGTKEVVIASVILSHVIYMIFLQKDRQRHYFLFTNPPEVASKPGYRPHYEYEQTRFC